MVEFHILLIQSLLFLLDDFSMLLDLNMLNLLLHLLQFSKLKNNLIFFGHDLLSLMHQVSLLEIQRIVHRLVLPLLLLIIVYIISIVGSEIVYVVRDTFSFLHRLILLFIHVIILYIFLDNYCVWISMQFATVMCAFRRQNSLNLSLLFLNSLLLSFCSGLLRQRFIRIFILGIFRLWCRLHRFNTGVRAIAIHQLNGG